MRITLAVLNILRTLKRIAEALERSNELAQYRNDREFPPLPETGKEPAKKVIITRGRDIAKRKLEAENGDS